MIQSPEVQARLALLRQKAVEGTATLEEYKEATLLMRGNRVGSHIASEKSRKAKVKAAVPTADDMLDELK